MGRGPHSALRWLLLCAGRGRGLTNAVATAPPGRCPLQDQGRWASSQGRNLLAQASGRPPGRLAAGQSPGPRSVLGHRWAEEAPTYGMFRKSLPGLTGWREGGGSVCWPLHLHRCCKTGLSVPLPHFCILPPSTPHLPGRQCPGRPQRRRDHLVVWVLCMLGVLHGESSGQEQREAWGLGTPRSPGSRKAHLAVGTAATKMSVLFTQSTRRTQRVQAGRASL